MSSRLAPFCSNASRRLSTQSAVCASRSPGLATAPASSMGHAPAAKTKSPATAAYSYGAPGQSGTRRRLLRVEPAGEPEPREQLRVAGEARDARDHLAVEREDHDAVRLAVEVGRERGLAVRAGGRKPDPGEVAVSRNGAEELADRIGADEPHRLGRHRQDRIVREQRHE